MKVLVTGATGFIGRHVIAELLKIDNIQIIATASNKERLIDYFSDKNVKIIPFNYYEQKVEGLDLYNFFSSPDKLIHLAWKGLPNYGEPFHLTENLTKEFNFITELVKSGLKDITITGTCFEYGMQEGELNEEMPAFPSNYYALAKDTLRKMLEIFQINVSFKFKWIRLFYMYGKGQSSKSLIAQLDIALENGDPIFNMSGGEQIRDYLPVQEVAKNIIVIALQNEILGIINNSSGIPQKLSSFVINYLKEINAKIKLNLGFYPYSSFEPMEFWGRIEKLNKLK